jgi:hypothetical protein
MPPASFFDATELRASSARLSFSTLITGSPMKPSSGRSIWLSTSAFTVASSSPRAVATRGTWKNAASGETCGSRPEPEVVTRSIGIGASGFSARNASASASMRSISAGLVGPRFEPEDAAAL